jgi:hypothetical protein
VVVAVAVVAVVVVVVVVVVAAAAVEDVQTMSPMDLGKHGPAYGGHGKTTNKNTC